MMYEVSVEPDSVFAALATIGAFLGLLKLFAFLRPLH